MKKTTLPQGLNKDKEGRYRLELVSRYTQPGKRYRERLPEKTTRVQAEAYLAKRREDDRLGQLRWPSESKQDATQPEPWTVGRFAVEVYLPYCETRNRQSTIERKKQALKEIAPWFWEVELKDVRTALVAKFQQERKGEGVRARTVNLGLATLQHLLSVAHELEYLAVAARKFKKLPEKDKKPARFLSREEAAKVLERAKDRGQVWYALTMFLLHTGARWEETRELRWKDVDLEGGWVLFRGKVAKGGKDRQVPLIEEVVRVLAELPKLGARVFLHEWRGRAWKMPIYGRLGKESGYPWDPEGDRVSPHVFRHTFAAWRLRAGVSPALVQAWLGHSTISLTVDLYGHVQAGEAREQIGRY